MTWNPLDWFNLDPATNTTTLKAVWSVRLWIGTFVVWAMVSLLILMVKPEHVPAILLELFIAWLGGLSAFSGFSYAQYRTSRTTDYGFVERKAGTVNTDGQTKEQPVK